MKFYLNYKSLIKRFPFLTVKSMYGNALDGYTWLDYLPRGWFYSFSRELTKDLAKAIRKNKIEDFNIVGLKEKNGVLRIYYYPYEDSIEEVIEKYSKISEKKCVVCGAESKRVVINSHLPYCNKCFIKYSYSFLNKN